jgi:hypothetical protein
MDYIVGLLLGWFFGSVYTNYRHIQNLRRIAEERGLNLDTMAKSIVESESKKIPILFTEKRGETMYLFEKESNTFICQGSDIDELAKKSLEYRNIPVAMVEDGTNEIWFFEGQVKKNIQA